MATSLHIPAYSWHSGVGQSCVWLAQGGYLLNIVHGFDRLRQFVSLGNGDAGGGDDVVVSDNRKYAHPACKFVSKFQDLQGQCFAYITDLRNLHDRQVN